MEIKELQEMFLGEMTGQQFITLLFACLFAVVLAFIIADIMFHILRVICALVVYLCRKDKYKQYDFAVVRAYRQIASLRKQVKYAPTEKAYVLYYNQLIGAVHFAREMGYISERNVLRIVDIPCNYEKEREADESN